MESNDPLTWLCVDDGTERDVFYISNTGKKSRNKPDLFSYELLENGKRRYFFREKCIRCNRQEFPSVISAGDGEFVFAFNHCSSCLLLLTQISKIDGNTILHRNGELPLIMFINTKTAALSFSRDRRITDRANDSRFLVLTDAKRRRNQSRIHLILQLKATYNIGIGEHTSWGFDDQQFDEYFGELNSSGQPQGRGIKLYSDGSVYVGNWCDGKREANRDGRFIRPNGAEYEGSWVGDYKHGKGKQFYCDGSVYEGDFMNDVEHGIGLLTYADGAVFSGRFRFGKRDGPGTMYSVDKVGRQGNFKDADVLYFDEPPPRILERRETDSGLLQARSLLDISSEALAKAICTSDIAQKVSRTIYAHLKPLVARMTVHVGSYDGTKDFKSAVETFAFLNLETINLNGVKMTPSDVSVLLSLEGRSDRLNALSMVSTRLDGLSLQLLSTHLAQSLWPRLCILDLSRNLIQSDILGSLVNALSMQRSLSTLKLSCCGLRDDCAYEFAKLLSSDIGITDLDLSFNSLKVSGADILAEALPSNHTLLNLNLRANGIEAAGGHSLARALKSNNALRVLCLVDNQVGEEVIALVSARLRGRTRDVLKSLKTNEMNPSFQTASYINKFLCMN